MLKKHLKSAVYVSLLIYIYISVFSYNYKDLSLNTATNEEVTNLGGVVGSYLADILVQFFGLASITIATTIVYFLISKRLLKIFYLTLINIGICAILPKFSLGITTRYMHGGIIGNALINNFQFWIFAVVASIGIVGLIGWKRTVYSLLFLCKKIFSLFTKVLFFRLRKTTDYSIAPLVIEGKYRTTRQQPKKDRKKLPKKLLNHLLANLSFQAFTYFPKWKNLCRENS